MSSKKSSTSSSRRKPSLKKMTATQMSIDEDTEPVTPTHFDTSKTGLMRKSEWTRQAFKKKKTFPQFPRINRY